jgi:MFS family permease
MLAGLLGQEIVWLGPSPILPEIIDEFSINLSQAGLLVSIVNLIAALIGVVGGTLIIKFGLKPVFAWGLFLISFGSIASIVAENYAQLLIFRIVVGVGFGLCLPVSGVVVSGWFKGREKLYLNTISSMLPYFGAFIVFSLSPLIFQINQNWKHVIFAQGLITLFALLFWCYFGKEIPDSADTLKERLKNVSISNSLHAIWKEWKLVLEKRDVILLSLAEMGDMWSFQLLSAYLVVFFVSQYSMEMREASWLASIFPLAGIVGGLFSGFLMERTRKRRLFTWPFHIMIFCGTQLILFTEGLPRLVGIVLAGFGNAAWAPALYTLPMEFTGVTTRQVGLIYGLVFSLGFFAAFFSPIVGGWLAQFISIRTVIMLFSFSSLFAAAMLFKIGDTNDRND